MTLAYRIIDWKKIGEVTDKGRAAQEDTPDERIRKTRPTYIRWKIEGHSLSQARRRLSKKAWLLGPMMDVACDGIYIRLLDLAGDWDDPELRGWILDDRKRPMNPFQVADLFEIKDTDHIKAVFDLLCDSDIGLLELVEFPHGGETGGKIGGGGGGREKAEFSGFSPAAGESGGDLRKVGEKGGEVEKPFLNETETEVNNNLKLNETERDNAGIPDQGGREGAGRVFQPPPSALVAGSVSGIPVSVSDSAPRGEAEIKKRRAQAFLELCEIITPRGSSDRTTFRDIFDQLEKRMIYETEEPLFDRALEKAKESCLVGRVPAAIFVAAMKKTPFCYVPEGKSLIRGRTDEYRHNF